MMTKFKVLLGICFLTVFACNTSTQQSEDDGLLMEEDGLTIEKNELNPQEDKFMTTKRLIGQTIDPTYSDVTDFNQFFDSYTFFNDGEIEKVNDATAIDLYHQILDGREDNFDKAPLFEVKNAEKVVLLVKGKGIWANILIDKQNSSILNIQFLPESKTSTLRTKEEVFQKQFIGSTINFSENNFGLKPWDKETGTGDIQIDGISGATDICQATVDMLNNQLKLYDKYFQQSNSSKKEE